MGAIRLQCMRSFQGSVPAPDLDKATHRAAQQQAAAAALRRGVAFPVEHWRWALSVRHSPIICPLIPSCGTDRQSLDADSWAVYKTCLGGLGHYLRICCCTPSVAGRFHRPQERAGVSCRWCTPELWQCLGRRVWWFPCWCP